MSGGIYDKWGNWFEEAGVILHLLLVADEQERSLLWEGKLDDSLGVDCWIRRDSDRIAEQYKTRTTDPWSIADLGRGRRRADGGESASVLKYARLQLSRNDADGATEYRLVTNNTAPELSDAIQSARVIDDSVLWLEDDDKKHDSRIALIKGFGFDPAVPGDVAQAHGLLRRMVVRYLDRQTLCDHMQVVATALSPTPDLLMSSLLKLARASLSCELTTQRVRQHLAAEAVEVAEHTGHHRIGPELDAAIDAFDRSITGARRLALIQREDAAIAAAAAVEPDRARTVIVHGPAGVGKTEVILQAIALIRATNTPMLVIRADEADNPPCGPDPIRSLSRYAAGKRACLVIDQVDQVVLAGQRTQHLLKPLMQWIVLARALNVSIVVGCRTVDVDLDTHLKRVLCPDDEDRFRKVEIKDVTEEQAKAILTKAGIPIGTIHPDLLPIIRRPIVLHLLIEIVERGGSYSRARTILDLVVNWWERLREPHGTSADEVLNAMVGAVERDGSLSIDRLHLPHRAVIDALVVSGVLIDEGRGLVRPFHQVLIDVWLARQWNDVQSKEDLLRRLGDREDQSLHHARRLRLAIQLFASRGRHGAEICDAILRSEQIRPLLKRAMLMGIAAIDAPDSDWVLQIVAWLDDPTLHEIVSGTVVYQRVAWMDRLLPWLRGAWEPTNGEKRRRLLSLVAAVGRIRGDLVAACLTAWSQEDSTVLAEAHMVFWHDPSQDSEQLFELRLRYMAETQHRRDHFLKWKELLESHPTRAIRLFAYHLDRAGDQELLDRAPEWFHGWPATLTSDITSTGLACWRLLKKRWERLSVDNPHDIRTDRFRSGSEPTVIVALVELLSGSLAHALNLGAITWSALVAELPVEKRTIDQWLLLRCGAGIDSRHDPHGIHAEAARWFMGDPTLGVVSIGMVFMSSQLAEKFLTAICRGLNDQTQHDLEQWLIDYPKQLGEIPDGSRLEPEDLANRILEISYRLLSCTVASRRTTATESLLGILTARFGPVTARDQERVTGRGGWVRSDIDDATAMDMSCVEWIESLKTAPAHRAWHMPTGGGDHILSGDVMTKVRQLQYIAPLHPQRFFMGLQLFVDAEPQLPDVVLATIVNGITRTTPPDRPAPRGPWVPLDDRSVAAIFAIPRIRNSQSSASALCEAVRNRSHIGWDDDVLQRLADIARGETVAGFQLEDGGDLMGYRLNEQACQAIDALANVAHDHEERRSQLLDLAESLSAHSDPGRRASAGMLAIHARSSDPPRAFDLLLQVAQDPHVGAEDDISNALLNICANELASPEHRKRSIAILLGLASAPDRMARKGGRCILLLRAWGFITPENFNHALSASHIAREAAASTLADGLSQEKSPPVWMRELAVEFANDRTESVGMAILKAFDAGSEHLLEIPGFFPAMVRSMGASRDPQGMLELCCKSGDIAAMADEVLFMADGLVTTVVTADNQWRVSSMIEVAVNALQALVAKAEQTRNSHIRSRALDAWDRLIERNDLIAQKKLDTVTDFGVG